VVEAVETLQQVEVQEVVTVVVPQEPVEQLPKATQVVETPRETGLEAAAAVLVA
jgi:hypothetical protein